MAIIKIVPNKPLTVNLLYPSAKEKKGHSGIDFMYTLEGGHALFVPPIAHDEIQKLHAGPGEPFTLTKTIGPGNQAVWKVERILQNQGQNGENVGLVRQPSDPANMSIPSRPVDEVPNGCSPKSITKAPVTVMPAAAPSLTTPQSRAMVKQLFAAVDACKLTQDYAKQQGIEFEITSDIICRVAITAGIQVFREGVYT
jgi:hypothetical protein